MKISLQDLQTSVEELSREEKILLLNTLDQSLRQSSTDQASRQHWVDQLRGCLKVPHEEPPTDAEIQQWKQERLMEKYLK